MSGILLRVGCDATTDGGCWNAPVDAVTWDYAYVPIPAEEAKHKHISKCPTYEGFEKNVERFKVHLPPNLSHETKVHLDPDFKSLTFGEPFVHAKKELSSRGQIINRLEPGDFIAFYASFRPTQPFVHRLAYCLFGLFYIKRKTFVNQLDDDVRIQSAHGRREGAENDLVVWGTKANSGRFARAILIGEYRDKAYRVTKDLLDAWGGLKVKNGYIQRSVRPPFFERPEQFLTWLHERPEAKNLVWEN
ncbi:MAG: hypothetical protein ABSH06_01545 [Thermodesulfobacteriota bacterium]